MSKINTKSIVYALAILAILALGAVIMPTKANAQYDDGYAHLDPVVNPNPYIYSVKPRSGNAIIINGRGFIPSSVAKFDGENRPTTFIDYNHLLVNLSGNYTNVDGFFVTVFNGAPGGGHSNAVSYRMTQINQSPLPANNNDNNYTNVNNSQTVNAENGNSEDREYSALASNAVFGSNGFLPSGLVQWILFAIIILLIIIIVRRLMGASDRYHSEPLKHA